MEKTMKAVVTFPIFVKGKPKNPGDVIEGPESEIQPLIGIKRATADLSWKPAAKDKKASTK